MSMNDLPLAALLDQYGCAPPEDLLRGSPRWGESPHHIVCRDTSQVPINLDFNMPGLQIASKTRIDSGLPGLPLFLKRSVGLQV